MLLKNFSYGLVSLFLKSGSEDSKLYFKGTQGQNVGISTGVNIPRSRYGVVSSETYSGSSTEIHGNSTYFAAAYGTGTTAPTIDDYILSGSLITELAYTNGNITAFANGITFSHSITNTGDTSVTINEIALCLQYATSSNKACVMLTRDVLAEPIVLGPNEQRNVSIFVDSNSFVEGAA